MPLYEFLCDNCSHQFEELLKERPRTYPCPHCDKQAEILPSGHGGYAIRGNNGASQRPKQAGSFRGGKK